MAYRPRTVTITAALALALPTGLTLTTVPATANATTPTATGVTQHRMDAAYPRQDPLPEPAIDEDDAAIKVGAVPYHDISRRLNDVMEDSDRVSAEVISTTEGGRDIVLVTLTAPETQTQARRQALLRDRITEHPERAADDRDLAQAYKLPILINSNIHGNEFEGTDAALRLVEDYASSRDRDVVDLLDTSRIHLVISANPDGRHDNTRRNAAGFDLNRDLITASQPETRAIRDALIDTQPVLMLDLHGYVNGTLVDPTTPPHGENYEYDLFIKHAYPNALGIEEAITALGHDEDDGVRPVQIPLRDWEEGWDDWPPIFTPQYAALHGAVAHTVELPLRVNNASYDLPEDELQRRAGINIDIAQASMTATLRYAAEHRADLLADQIETFRRGAAGDRPTPVEDGLFDVIGPEDVYLTSYPRAFVIPVGAGQRSAPAAARLVEHLLANDVDVTRLSRATTISGRSYPQDSYVVDMHQAKRGMAHAVLGRGTDLSDRVDAMYDISGWSHALLWGADVDTIPEGVPLRILSTEVTEVDPTGDLADSESGWVLPMADPADAQALTTLLEQGVPVQMLDDGSVLVPAAYPWAAGNAADTYGVQLEQAPGEASGPVLEPSARVVGVSGTAEERWALEEMGFTVQEISTGELNDGVDLDSLDALYVSSGLRWRELDAEAKDELADFVAGGGGLVGRGPAGVALNDALDLLEVTTLRSRGDGNGVVRVDNSPDSPISGAATSHTFVYSPLWFTDLGDGVRVDQRFAERPLVSGHWKANPSGEDGPDDAAGQPLVVSGEVEGSRAVLFGSEPLFRAHPKGQYALVARSLMWVGGAGTE